MRSKPLLVVLALTVLGGCPREQSKATPATTRMLFVGNSYVYVNDLPAKVRTLAPDSSTDSVAYGAYTLSQHLADAQGSGAHPRLSTLFEAQWSSVVFQEQSQIPSFDAADAKRKESIAAAVALSEYAAKAHATTVLFMTWGYAKGDYLAMQSRLEAGYRDMARAIAEAGRPVKIAPVGLAFKKLYERDVAAGRDPLAGGSSFEKLYDPDASHPALAGTYLAACVLAATIQGSDPTTFTGDVAGVDGSLKVVLQTAARDAVAAERASERSF